MEFKSSIEAIDYFKRMCLFHIKNFVPNIDYTDSHAIYSYAGEYSRFNQVIGNCLEDAIAYTNEKTDDNVEIDKNSLRNELHTIAHLTVEEFEKRHRPK